MNRELCLTYCVGAGSVLETLQAGRPLVVVINELLMDNHQLELASQLAEDGHLYYATCRSVLCIISSPSLDNMKQSKLLTACAIVNILVSDWRDFL